MKWEIPNGGPDAGIEVIDVGWREFPELLKTLSQKSEEDDSTIKPALFRGQTDSEWGLKTTLERSAKIGNDMSVGTYNASVIAMGTLMKGFIEDLPDFDGKTVEFPAAEDLKYTSLQNKELVVFLRHHGFPSPLLDWSRSPYVAAYFAFREDSPSSDSRAIYYFEQPRSWSGEAGFELYDLGTFVAGGRRHSNQQAQYTWCSRRMNETAYFDSHQQHLRGHLKKIRISSACKDEVLSDLQTMNINEFSLFGSTDAFVSSSLRLMTRFGF